MGNGFDPGLEEAFSKGRYRFVLPELRGVCVFAPQNVRVSVAMGFHVHSVFQHIRENDIETERHMEME